MLPPHRPQNFAPAAKREPQVEHATTPGMLLCGPLKPLIPLPDGENWLGDGTGRWLFERIRGHGGDRVHASPASKSMSHEETFSRDLVSDEALETRLLRLVTSLAAALRGDGLRAGCITVKLRDHDFTTRQARPCRSRSAPTERLEVARACSPGSAPAAAPLHGAGGVLFRDDRVEGPAQFRGASGRRAGERRERSLSRGGPDQREAAREGDCPARWWDRRSELNEVMAVALDRDRHRTPEPSPAHRRCWTSPPRPTRFLRHEVTGAPASRAHPDDAAGKGLRAPARGLGRLSRRSGGRITA